MDIKLDEIQMNLLSQIAGLHEVPSGAYNIRSNGETAGRTSTENIDIVTKTDKPGIDIYIKEGTKNESLHIPVILSKSGLSESVYNDFHIGDDCDVLIVAGCGIHNGGEKASQHDGIHTFYIGRNSRVRYVEKHYGKGEGTGDIVMNPETIVNIAEGGSMEMDTVQIEGITSTDRLTRAVLAEGASITVKEKIMTHDKQFAKTRFEVEMNGADSSAHIVSRSVAKNESLQEFYSVLIGNNKCMGHSECDSIIMDNAVVRSIPEITANSVDAALIHEAAIGKIAGEQIIKLMTLGLTEQEAEEKIINGFMK